MRLIVQRVEKAKVTRRAQDSNSWKKVGEIGIGLLVLVGFKKGDNEKAVELLAAKVSKLRVMSDEQDKMNLSINDSNGRILVVSQFTLYADASGGNRPSFLDAEEPEKAKSLYELFITSLRAKNINIETGSFGDYMKIDAVLDGPVTIIYDN
jgi:D-tyrosyl-tRNA(Tyr) deacylase